MRVRAYVCAYMCVCVRARVRVRAYVWACVRVRMCARARACVCGWVGGNADSERRFVNRPWMKRVRIASLAKW